MLSRTKITVMSLQHLLAMFGATVLVPVLVGIPPSVALFTSGVGTLIFHFCTQFKVPAYLGSSFAYIAPIITVTSYYAANGNSTEAIAYATGGILVAGFVKMLFAYLMKKIGVEKITKVFTPVITGTMIVLIGLILASVAVDMAASNWVLALVAMGAIIITKIFGRGFTKLLPIIFGAVAGYLVALALGEVTFEVTKIVSIPHFVLPKFSWYAFSIVVPAAIAPAIEHIGDIFVISETAGKPFYKDPGMHRTLFGDGLATSFAGLLGGPANTTYSENTGVMALTKVYDPVIMRIAAVFAIILSFFPPVEAAIMSIPQAVMGGISIFLFGMIASIGMKVLVTNKVKFTDKNLIIMSLMLIFGLGGAAFSYGEFNLQGLGLAAIIGVILQLVLPGEKHEDTTK